MVGDKQKRGGAMEKKEGGLRQGIVQALGGWGQGKKRGSERAREKKEGGLRQGAAIPPDWLILTVLSTLYQVSQLLSIRWQAQSGWHLVNLGCWKDVFMILPTSSGKI